MQINELFVKFINKFKYTIDLIESNYFPYDNIKQDIITKYKSSNYNIASLKYQLMSFNVTTSYSKIHVNPIEKLIQYGQGLIFH
jgi:hypothetical protein